MNFTQAEDFSFNKDDPTQERHYACKVPDPTAYNPIAEEHYVEEKYHLIILGAMSPLETPT